MSGEDKVTQQSIDVLDHTKQLVNEAGFSDEFFYRITTYRCPGYESMSQDEKALHMQKAANRFDSFVSIIRRMDPKFAKQYEGREGKLASQLDRARSALGTDAYSFPPAEDEKERS